MLEFVNDLDVRVLNDKTHLLLEDFIIKYYDYTFIIPAGFRTDFASVPRLPIIYMLFAERAKRPAVFHDWLYATHELGSRLLSDVAFLDAMTADGLALGISQPMYRGVRIGGESRWNEGPASIG